MSDTDGVGDLGLEMGLEELGGDSNEAAGDGDLGIGNGAQGLFNAIGSVVGIESSGVVHGVNENELGGGLEFGGGEESRGRIHVNGGDFHKGNVGGQSGNGSANGDFFDKESDGVLDEGGNVIDDTDVADKVATAEIGVFDKVFVNEIVIVWNDVGFHGGFVDFHVNSESGKET